MRQVPSIQFALGNIRTEEFAKFEENYIADKPVEVSSGLSFSIHDENEHLVICNLSVECAIKNKIFLKIKVLFLYQIEKKSWLAMLEENNRTYIFPKNFVSHIAVLSLGTVRGIVFEKLKKDEGELSKFILPLINISDMIDEDVKIEIEEKS